MRAALAAAVLLVFASRAEAEDVTFSQALRLAASQSPYVVPRQRELGARVAADGRIPWLTQNPQLLLEPGVRVAPGNETGPELIVTLTQGISLDGLGDARRTSARHERDALDAEMRAAALSQRLEVARHWILLWGAQQALALAREERDGARELRDRIARAVAAEERTRLDLADADAYVAESEAQVVDAEGYVFELGIGLAIEIGMDPARPVLAAGDPPVIALDEAAAHAALAHADALPDAEAVRIGAIAARARQAEDAAQQGTLLLVGASVHADQPGGFVASGVIGIVPPVFEHGERQAAVASGDAARLEQGRLTARLEARLRIAEALHEVEHSREREQVLEAGLVPAGQARVALQERAFAGGETTLFRVLDARRALLDARRRLAAAHAERVWAEAKLDLLTRAAVVRRAGVSRALVAACALVVAACGGTHEPADERDDSRASIASRYVRVSAPSDVALLEAPARVLAGPDAVAVVAVTYRAQVRRVRVQAGSHVAAGEALLDVAAPEVVSAAARYVATEAPLAIANQRLTRLEALRAEGLAEASTLFEVQARAADLREERAMSLATLRAAGVDVRDAPRLGRDGTITLSSPIDGVVRDLDATPGEVREGGAAPFATIVAVHGTRVEARFPRAPPPGARFALRTTDDRDVDLGASPLGSATSPDDGTVILWLAVPDATDLAPGLRGTVRAAPPAGVLEVPLRAVRAERGESFVLVRAESGERRAAVHVLASSGASALVTGALHEGDEVVADAAALLDPPGTESP